MLHHNKYFYHSFSLGSLHVLHKLDVPFQMFEGLDFASILLEQQAIVGLDCLSDFSQNVPDCSCILACVLLCLLMNLYKEVKITEDTLHFKNEKVEGFKWKTVENCGKP